MSSQLSQVICNAALFQGGASECQSGGAEAAAGVGGWGRGGAGGIGDLIKAQGACLAPYSYRLPVSHLVPVAARAGS